MSDPQMPKADPVTDSFAAVHEFIRRAEKVIEAGREYLGARDVRLEVVSIELLKLRFLYVAALNEYDAYEEWVDTVLNRGN
jgi:hypothetical protein